MSLRAYSRNISSQDESFRTTFNSGGIIRRWEGNDGRTAGKPDISYGILAGARETERLWIMDIYPFNRENRANSLYHRRVVQPAIELRRDVEIVNGARIPRVADQGALDTRSVGDGQSCYGPAFDRRFIPATGQRSDIQTWGREFVDRFLRMLGKNGSKAESCEEEDDGGIHSRIGWQSYR